MSDFPEFMRIIVPTVVIPIGVFAGNWAIRFRSNYAQTAASDFLLAILIFDGAVVTTAKDFEPFIRNPELKQIVLQWHVCLAFAGMAVWWLIATFAEPLVESYYSSRFNKTGSLTFVVTLMICWVAVFMLVSAHIGFFVVDGVARG